MKGHEPKYAEIIGGRAMSGSRCECGHFGAVGHSAEQQREWHRKHTEKVLRLWRDETFEEDHEDGIGAIRKRAEKDFWHDRYVTTYGMEPQPGWWSEATYGGGLDRSLREPLGFREYDFNQELWDFIVSRYRSQVGLPAEGESQKLRAELARCTRLAMPSHEVISPFSDPSRGLFHLDVFVPARSLAMEYLSAEQCFGDEVAPYRLGDRATYRHFKDQALDWRRRILEEKRRNCQEAGISLEEWDCRDPIDEAAVRVCLARWAG